MSRSSFHAGVVAMFVPARKSIGTAQALRAILLAISTIVAAGDPATADNAAPAPAAVNAIGDALPELSLHDQHGVAARIDTSTRILLFTRDMDGGAFVKEALNEDGSATLTNAQAVYVSDVSGMPGLIRSAFALPSLRRRSYRVVLNEAGTATATLPYSNGKVTVLVLESGQIAAVSFASSATEVRAALGK
ncbi:MAG: hypothetical protein ABR587_12060 [Candidatus Binatia bacterium]